MKERWLIEVTEPAHHYACFAPDGSYTVVDDPNDATRWHADFGADAELDGAAQLERVRQDHPLAFCSRHWWSGE